MKLLFFFWTDSKYLYYKWNAHWINIKFLKKLCGCATIKLVFSLFVSSRRKRRRASRHKKALKCQQDKSKVRPFMVCPNTLLIWANFSSSRCGGSICCCKVKKMWCYLGLLKMPREREAPHFYELKYVWLEKKRTFCVFHFNFHPSNLWPQKGRSVVKKNQKWFQPALR